MRAQTKLHFTVNQAEATERGVRVAAHYWCKPLRERWSGPTRAHFEALVNARQSYDGLGDTLDPALFIDTP